MSDATERMRRWRQANPERAKAQNREQNQRWREANPERLKEQWRRQNERRRKGPTRHEVICSRCQRPFEYTRTTKAKTVCPPCREVDWAWKLYGLNSVSLPAFYEAHDNRCDICGGTESLTQWGHRLVIDHDHVTGELRGLLCNTCNAGLGQFGDDIDRMRAAIAYVEAHRRPNDQLRLI